MDCLPPIPTPPAQWWRECRLRIMPFVLFALAAGGVTLMWRQNVAAPMLVGEVEAIRSNVSSPKGGKLSQLNVTRLQPVRAGDVIAQVVTTDPEILQSSLAVIQAEIGLLRVNLEPLFGQQRLAMTYDRLRLDWMDQRVQLVTAKVRLELAGAELRRTEQLFKEKVVSMQVLETAQSAQQSLQAEVDERNRLVAEQEQQLKLIGANGGATRLHDSSPDEVMRASIRVQEEKLRLTEAELSPVRLTVPMDGTVTEIHHRTGEAVLAGEAIVTITATNSDRILSYLRQPLPFQPRVGMRVEVRSRAVGRCVSEASILEVGAQMEPITATLTVPAHEHFQEVGLPVLVSIPASQKFRPGELVDLRIVRVPSAAGLHWNEEPEVR